MTPEQREVRRALALQLLQRVREALPHWQGSLVDLLEQTCREHPLTHLAMLAGLAMLPQQLLVGVYEPVVKVGVQTLEQCIDELIKLMREA